MGRRGENIRQRNDGRWEARVVCGAPVNGKTNYKYLYSRSYQGVRALKKEFLLNLSISAAAAQAPPAAVPVVQASGEAAALPLFVPPDSVEPEATLQGQEEAPSLFCTVAYDWLAAKKLSIKGSSYAIYSFVLEKHLLPTFGDLAVKDLDTGRIDTFLLEKKEHGGIRDGGPLSDKTVSEIKGALSQVLRYAKSHNIIAAVPDSMPVSVKQPPVEVLTKQEQEAIEKKAMEEDTLFSLGVLIGLSTGIREGELCGLQWSDFNWENGTISITKTVSRIANADKESGSRTHVEIGTPKTLCSIRTVPIPSKIITYIKERAGEGSDYVLTGSEKFMEPRVCRDRYARLERRAGVKHHCFHILRHTYATNCIADGVNIKVLSVIMGHSNVNITL